MTRLSLAPIALGLLGWLVVTPVLVFLYVVCLREPGDGIGAMWARVALVVIGIAFVGLAAHAIAEVVVWAS